MYEFHYKYIKSKYTAKLYFTDTDSLVYETETDDVYEDFYGEKNFLDFSDYLQESKFFDFVNKNVIGKMKYEIKGKIISEFVGLKSEMYSLIAADGREIKKTKGVNKNVVKSTGHKEFVGALFNKKIMRHNMKRIQSKLHCKVNCIELELIALAKFVSLVLMIKDILGDGINSLVYFHKDIRSQ